MKNGKRILDGCLSILKTPQFFAAIFALFGAALGFSEAWANEKANAASVIGGAVALILGYLLAAFSDPPRKKKANSEAKE